MIQKITEYLFQSPYVVFLTSSSSSGVCHLRGKKRKSENKNHLSKTGTSVPGRQAKCAGAHEQRELACRRGMLQGGSDDPATNMGLQ